MVTQCIKMELLVEYSKIFAIILIFYISVYLTVGQ